jgi:ABC-2 type transport system ATP-binding protein
MKAKVLFNCFLFNFSNYFLILKIKINDLLEKLDLVSHKDKLAKNLSGGMKRKLCIAISLIGDPQVF